MNVQVETDFTNTSEHNMSTLLLILYVYIVHTYTYIYMCVCVFVLYCLCLCRCFCFIYIYIYIYIYIHRKHNYRDIIKSTHGATGIKFTSPKNGKQDRNIGTVLFSWVIRGLALNSSQVLSILKTRVCLYLAETFLHVRRAIWMNKITARNLHNLLYHLLEIEPLLSSKPLSKKRKKSIDEVTDVTSVSDYGCNSATDGNSWHDN